MLYYFGPSTFTLLTVYFYPSVPSDRPCFSRTVYFGTDRPLSYERPLWELSTFPLYYFWAVHFYTFIASDRPLIVEWPPTLTHNRPLWLESLSITVPDRLCIMQIACTWLSNLAHIFILPLCLTVYFWKCPLSTASDRPFWSWLYKLLFRN